MLVEGDGYSKDMETFIHRTIKKVSQDYETLKFNTAIAAMMSLINEFYGKNSVNKAEMKTFLVLLSPVSPHIAEEMWEIFDFEGRVTGQKWPVWNEEKTIDESIEIAIQLNGKVRQRIMVPSGLDRQQTVDIALKNAKVRELINSRKIIKSIGVPGKLVNLVVK